MTEAPPLAEIRARYPGVVPENSTLSAAPRQGFSGGRVWRIDTAAGPLAFKRHATLCDPERLDAVGSVLLQAGRMGLEVNAAAVALPVPILDCNGAAFTRIDREFYTLAPWLPGEPPREPITEAMVVRAAEALAKWHLMGRAINVPWKLGPEDELVAFRERRSVIAPAARRRRRRFEEWLFQEPPGEPLDGELRDLAFATQRALRLNASAVKD
ncbi:MAG TPA: hypothetical protein VNC50_00720, partial [Planctomycetia bacterium]|nr:hypothetical protein [Planctomycetia bacterium]